MLFRQFISAGCFCSVQLSNKRVLVVKQDWISLLSLKSFYSLTFFFLTLAPLFSFQISASMCRTRPSPCSSARSRKKETPPRRTVSIFSCSNLNQCLVREDECQVSPPEWLNIFHVSSSLRDDCGTSGHRPGHRHPGTDCGDGERPLPPGALRFGGGHEQLHDWAQ